MERNIMEKIMQNPNDVLEHVYLQLDYAQGKLLPAAKDNSLVPKDDWLNNGEWLIAASNAGASRVFFVDNNPVIIFATGSADQTERIRIFNKIWGLGRPGILFLATPGELLVIDLAQTPIPVGNRETLPKKHLKLMHVIKNISDVEKKLHDFHRNNIESGQIYEHGLLGNTRYRADKSLISDIASIRNELMRNGLAGENLKFAHALIGRSIFIRYLEDRKIITADYFHQISKSNVQWQQILNQDLPQEKFNISETKSIYAKILSDKDFTYAVFEQLSQDFNGDMFPNSDLEQSIITQEHLHILQGLLYGDVGIQNKLFFFSYDFNVVPLDLISSIYENFYHLSQDSSSNANITREKGVYYTPPALAEFLVSRVLTEDILSKNPRVLDPACGSGIFLVEAFRRIVRYRVMNGEQITFDVLVTILKEQIAGIELNSEAARISAFSLYIALLNYLAPPSIIEQINKGKKLPKLILEPKQMTYEQFLRSMATTDNGTILVGDSFDSKLFPDSLTILEHNGLLDASSGFIFDNSQFDVIIGNPPWGGRLSKNASDEAKICDQNKKNWCAKHNKVISDNESSQAFIWRSLAFLKPNGILGLYVSAGVLFKTKSTALGFQNLLFSSVCLREIYNFTPVRGVFFAKAISPFILIKLLNKIQDNVNIEYWSPKQILKIKSTQSVLFNRYDRSLINPKYINDEIIWKVFWFGRNADYQFIQYLRSFNTLNTYIDCIGRGFETCKPDCFNNQISVPDVITSLSDYIMADEVKPAPLYPRTLGPNDIYPLQKLLIAEGIYESGKPKGMILAWYDPDGKGFYRSVYGVTLKKPDEETYLLLQGVLNSSLIRYYHFLTSATWGLWHHKILKHELLNFPISFENTDSDIKTKIINLVKEFRSNKTLDFQEYQKKLDSYVYDLYYLNNEQIDLIEDCCNITIPYFYKPKQRTLISNSKERENILIAYAKIFIGRWKLFLNDNESLLATIYSSNNSNFIAVQFDLTETTDKSSNFHQFKQYDELKNLDESTEYLKDDEKFVFEKTYYHVSDNSIIIIKKNDKRLWTKSIAREDANTTAFKVMNLLKSKEP